MLYLFPADPLHPARPDDHFAPEADAAKHAGHLVGIIDHDACQAGDGLEAVRRIRGRGPAVYRGWMLRSHEYAALDEALRSRGVSLRTSPSLYTKAHEFPGWYSAFEAHTPTSVWTDGADLDNFTALLGSLPPGPAVIKDWVKSMKHYWDQAAYLPDTSDTDTSRRVAGRFLQLRGEDLVGGIVIRVFEPFAGPEARTWWVDGDCVLVSAHPDTPDATPDDVAVGGIARCVAILGSPFVTVDLARRSDGRWRVVEVGDGQVSDRPVSVAPSTFVAAIGA